MSTQRRVVHEQRFAILGKTGTERAGTENPSSPDAGVTGSQQQFRRVARGLTASSSPFRHVRIELAPNSVSVSSCRDCRESRV